MKKTPKIYLIVLLSVIIIYVGVSRASTPSPYDDLRVILQKSWLIPQTDPLLYMLAAEATNSGDKTLPADQLVSSFRLAFERDEVIAKFYEAHAKIFSDEEIHEIRQIIETPVYEKYTKEAGPLFETNLRTMKALFAELVETNGVKKEKTEPKDSLVIEITQENFNEEVTLSTIPVVIDVHASWCQPCALIGPMLEELSHDYRGRIKFVKLDFDAQADLAKQYEIGALPTLLFISPGAKLAGRSVGFVTKQQITDKISEFFP